jgi:hypothetical protein
MVRSNALSIWKSEAALRSDLVVVRKNVLKGWLLDNWCGTLAGCDILIDLAVSVPVESGGSVRFPSFTNSGGWD